MLYSGVFCTVQNSHLSLKTYYSMYIFFCLRYITFSAIIYNFYFCAKSFKDRLLKTDFIIYNEGEKKDWDTECKKVYGISDHKQHISIRISILMSTQDLKIPVIGLNRRKTEDGLLISARNLYRSSSLKRSPSYFKDTEESIQYNQNSRQ